VILPRVFLSFFLDHGWGGAVQDEQVNRLEAQFFGDLQLFYM